MPIFRHLPRLILALLALLLITCIALWNMDLGRFQSSIEAFASEALGWELRVETLSVQLGSELTFSGSGFVDRGPRGDAPQLASGLEAQGVHAFSASHFLP